MFEVDQGVDFGKWGDATSQFMYNESLDLILPLVRLHGSVGDFGGANGILKNYHYPVTTIDVDASKAPDVVDDILTHTGEYDIAWARYVMHYLTDQQVMQFLDNVRAPRIIIVQFVNDDLHTKYRNSVGETKYFRTGEQMKALLPSAAREVMSLSYHVSASFYANRLGLKDATPHGETIKVYEILQ